MKSVDNVIGEKLGKVREYKRAILGEENEGEEQAKKKKKITFVWFVIFINETKSHNDHVAD